MYTIKMNTAINTIDQYIAQYPKQVQPVLEKIRQTIQKCAPDAKEKISYGIPTFELKTNLVHFGAYPNHIGFYPGAAAIVHFEDKLKTYHTSKGTVQFQLNQPIPYDLIKEITNFRVQNARQQ